MAMNFKTIDQSLSGKTVLIRCDFNVPLEEGQITETARIDANLKTIRQLISLNCKVVLISHLGSPKGFDEKLSLRPVWEYLKSELKQDVGFAQNYYPNLTRESLSGITLLENLRFYKEEEENNEDFAKFLAGLCDCYVNDAFSVCHRKHASIVGVPKFVAEKFAGLTLAQEVNALQKVLAKPEKPLTFLVGGFKASTKIPIMKNLLGRADNILVGGAMVASFWAAQGVKLGKTYFEERLLDDCREILENQETKVYLAQDFICASTSTGSSKTVSLSDFPEDCEVFDIGPKTRQIFGEILGSSRTVCWNGPLGMFEEDRFAEGTKEVISSLTTTNAFKVAGGGETVTFLNKYDLFSVFDYVSLAGGAFLEFLEGKSLPGLKALES